MTKDFIIFIQFIIITICINSILLNRYKTDKLLTSLENMIDSALKGSFTEKVFDESRLSALETKFAQYLSGQTCSTQNIMHEKDSIKTLIADISHQTKTPVANILLYCELLLEDDLSENSKNNLMALYSQTKKLRFLIESLIKLSRLETGIISLSPKKQEIQPIFLSHEYLILMEMQKDRLVHDQWKENKFQNHKYLAYFYMQDILYGQYFLIVILNSMTIS